MYVSQHRHVHFVFHFLQDAKSFGEAGSAKTADGSAIRFVVRGFEDEGNVQGTSHALDDFRHEERVFLTLNHTRTGDEKQVP